MYLSLKDDPKTIGLRKDNIIHVVNETKFNNQTDELNQAINDSEMVDNHP
jgi:hypothetical protein